MSPTSLRKSVVISGLIYLAVPAVFTRAVNTAHADCAAGKLYCYDTPVHLDAPINTAGFEGGHRSRRTVWSCTSFPIGPGHSAGRAIRTSTSADAGRSTTPGAPRNVCHLRCRAPSSTSHPRFRSMASICTSRRIALVHSVHRGPTSGYRTVHPSITTGVKR